MSVLGPSQSSGSDFIALLGDEYKLNTYDLSAERLEGRVNTDDLVWFNERAETFWLPPRPAFKTLKDSSCCLRCLFLKPGSYTITPCENEEILLADLYVHQPNSFLCLCGCQGEDSSDTTTPCKSEEIVSAPV